MPIFDPQNDVTPKLPWRNTNNKPGVAELRSAITGSAQAASYPVSVLNVATRDDLIYICRVHNITVNTTL